MKHLITVGVVVFTGFLIGGSALGQEENLPPEATIDCPERLKFLLDEKYPGEGRGTAPGDCRIYKYGAAPYSKLNRYSNAPGIPSCGPVLGPSTVLGQYIQIFPRLGVCDEFNTADSDGWCPGVAPPTDQTSDPANRSVLESATRSDAGVFIINADAVTSNEGSAFRVVDCGVITPNGVDPTECGPDQIATVFDDDSPGECTGGAPCRVDGDCPGAEACGPSSTIGFGLKLNQNGNAGVTRCVTAGTLCDSDADCPAGDACELPSGDTVCCQSVVPDICPNLLAFDDYPGINRPVGFAVPDRLQHAPQIHDGGRGSRWNLSQTYVLTNDQDVAVQLYGKCSAGGCQEDTSTQNLRPLENGCTGSKRNFTTACSLVDVAQGNDVCAALDAHPDNTCFSTFVDDNFSGNHKPCASDADCDPGDACDVAGAEAECQAGQFSCAACSSCQPDVCSFAEIGTRASVVNMLPDSNPNPGICNHNPVYLVGNTIDLSPGGTGRSTGCALGQWYNEGGPLDQDPNPFFTSAGESDPQPGCLLKVAGAFTRQDNDCDGVDDQIPDLCPRLSEANTTADSNSDGIGDECQCGDATGDGAVTGLDIGATALCANAASVCDATFADADGDGSTTAQDIGGVVAVVNGGATTSELRCARNP